MGLFWLALLAFLGYSGWRIFFDGDKDRRQAFLRSLLVYAATAALSVVAFRSGMPWLLLLAALGYLIVRSGKLARTKRPPAPAATAHPKQQMSRADALGVLGLSEGASESEINERYRQLMRKVHPDQGGSPYLATQLNEAKRVLLD